MLGSLLCSGSPDLNPIEHLWDDVKRQVWSCDPASTTLQDLQDDVNAEWNGIPQECVVHLIKSMKDRMEAVIRARGGSNVLAVSVSTLLWFFFTIILCVIETLINNNTMSI